VRLHDFKLIADRTLDVSVDGLLLPLRTRVLTGESLIVSFSIPGMWIDVEATVARVIHGRRPGDDGLAIGVIFDSMAPSARAALAGFLHGRRTPLPRRGPLARMRRGEEAPKLADETAMQSLFGMSGCEIADVSHDAVLIEDDAERSAVRSERQVDGLGVLRAVLGAWQNLIIDNGAANSE
jgi:hypothetical protein